MLAFGDGSGIIYQWGSGHGSGAATGAGGKEEQIPSKINMYSRATELASAVVPPPPGVRIGDDSPLSLIGMPYYTQPLLSVWPATLTFTTGRPPPKIPSEVMSNVKMIDFVGYAPNPGTFRRNQILAMSLKKKRDEEDVPKFRSEQEREKWFGKRGKSGSSSNGQQQDDQKDDLSSTSTLNSSRGLIPRFYRKVEIKYSKFGIEDFDFGFYNKTTYGGLETHILNSYCNAMLQVLHCTRPLREVCKHHITRACGKEFCLACELGFLFRMLEDSKGLNCQASNFLRAFGNVPQASALGLFEPDQPSHPNAVNSLLSISYSSLIQNFNRFIMEQVHQEVQTVDGSHPANLVINTCNMAVVSSSRGAKKDEAGEGESSIVADDELSGGHEKEKGGRGRGKRREKRKSARLSAALVEQHSEASTDDASSSSSSTSTSTSAATTTVTTTSTLTATASVFVPFSAATTTSGNGNGSNKPSAPVSFTFASSPPRSPPMSPARRPSASANTNSSAPSSTSTTSTSGVNGLGVSGGPVHVPSAVQQIMGIPLISMSRCSCGHQSSRETYPFAVDLVYTKKGNKSPSKSSTNIPSSVSSLSNLLNSSPSHSNSSGSAPSPPPGFGADSSPSHHHHHHHHHHHRHHHHHHHHHHHNRHHHHHTVTPFTTVLQQSIQKETHTKAWCDRCARYQPTSQIKYLRRLPFVMSINANTGGTGGGAGGGGAGAGTGTSGSGAGASGSGGAGSGTGGNGEDELELWRTGTHIHRGKKAKKGPVEGEATEPEVTTWIPYRIALILNGTKLKVVMLDPDSFDVEAALMATGDRLEEGSEVGFYDLTATVVEIRHEPDPPHLVAHVREADKTEWYVFNDFLVQQVPEHEVFHMQRWKYPCVLQYSRIDVDEGLDLTRLAPAVDAKTIFANTYLNRRKDLQLRCKPLAPFELPNGPGFLCAIDAEFVALTKEETEIRSDGTRSVLRPSRLSLARVSLLRGAGPDEGVPFIDEYISTTEPIVDYLTEYSGIKAGDLDPNLSTYPLVPLKAAYKKLRYLVDLGCVFVGHGLKKDFRIINILVPPEQVIDTVDIFFIKNRQRKLSLRFLAWCLLRQDIQTDMHDSVEDAKTALALYKKYLQLKEEGTFEQVLEDVYEEGRALNYKPPVKNTNGGGMSSSTSSSASSSSTNLNAPPPNAPGSTGSARLPLGVAASPYAASIQGAGAGAQPSHFFTMDPGQLQGGIAGFGGPHLAHTFQSGGITLMNPQQAFGVYKNYVP
ncbi:poly(A)-specific ribonuclease [Quaeritorhiza haematococci]|nr:poly(A)-specific ribonuclease [Quaeritorhiza haematococci]